MLVYSTNLSLLELQVSHFAFFPFSVIDGFEWFWLESLHKNIQLMLGFLQAPFLVLHLVLPSWFYYRLMTFLMMLSVISLSMLMILLSTL